MVDKRAKRLQKFITDEEEAHYRVAAALAAGQLLPVKFLSATTSKPCSPANPILELVEKHMSELNASITIQSAKCPT